MAKAVGNDSIIFTAPLNSSRCMDDNEDNQLSTTLYIIQMIIYSITILVAIANITLHFVVKDLRTISGILAMILCISVIGSTSMATGSLSIIFANNISVACALLINFLYAMAFVYQAAKLRMLYQFANVMYYSYKSKHNQEKNIKKSVLKYIIFIIGSSIICFFLALATDIGVNGRIYSGIERYCRTEYDYTFLYVTVVYGEMVVFIILQFITFPIGLTLYFLASKKCCAMKSTNFRVTMVLVAIMGINIILLLILTIAKVPYTILIPVVTSATLAEQSILLIVFLLSKKVILACKIACLKDTRPPNNQQQVYTCATKS